jgi:hypothetical protein
MQPRGQNQRGHIVHGPPEVVVNLVDQTGQLLGVAITDLRQIHPGPGRLDPFQQLLGLFLDHGRKRWRLGHPAGEVAATT